MKKNLIMLFALTYLSIYSQSSVYKPFCENPNWTVASTSIGVPGYTTYQYQTDTVIGSYTYKKSKDVSSSSFVLFREDISQKRIYRYDVTNSLDYLYIDFNLNYGSSFNLTWGGSVLSVTVCAKDSMLINGCYHNKIVLSASNCFIRYSFVEGILSDIDPVNPFTWPGDPQVNLVCECHNGQFYYNDYGTQYNPYSCYLTCSPASTCTTIASINELSYDAGFEVYPNPVNGILNIECKMTNEEPGLQIRLSDIIGRRILLTAYTSKLDISDLEKGIYFISILKNDKTLMTRKIIKE